MVKMKNIYQTMGYLGAKREDWYSLVASVLYIEYKQLKIYRGINLYRELLYCYFLTQSSVSTITHPSRFPVGKVWIDGSHAILKRLINT